MGGKRTHRLLFLCLSVLLAGFLAIAVKSTPSPERTRVASGIGPSSFDSHFAAAAAVPTPPPPRYEHPIQPPVDPNADEAPPTDAPPIEPAVRDRAPIVRAVLARGKVPVMLVPVGVESPVDRSGPKEESWSNLRSLRA